MFEEKTLLTMFACFAKTVSKQQLIIHLIRFLEFTLEYVSVKRT